VSRPSSIPELGFFERLALRAQAADTLLCVGLDPHPELLAKPTAAAAREFCLRLIEATAEHACAFKPNSAFFERFGRRSRSSWTPNAGTSPPQLRPTPRRPSRAWEPGP
jgi:hypothetical protein